MRDVRLSRTFFEQLHTLLEQGYPRFGAAVVAEKRNRVFAFIESYLAYFPSAKRSDPISHLTAHGVDKTPFVILYDYDDLELRIHFIVHKSADRSKIDLSSAEWD